MIQLPGFLLCCIQIVFSQSCLHKTAFSFLPAFYPWSNDLIIVFIFILRTFWSTESSGKGEDGVLVSKDPVTKYQKLGNLKPGIYNLTVPETGSLKSGCQQAGSCSFWWLQRRIPFCFLKLLVFADSPWCSLACACITPVTCSSSPCVSTWSPSVCLSKISLYIKMPVTLD